MNDNSPFKEYWLAYGGWKALLTSRYFWGALILNTILFSTWYPIDSKWWEQVTSIIPNILGFTLGGFAMWVAIGDEKFKSLIAGAEDDEDDDISPYMEVNATFTHFVLLQLIALVLAIVASNFDHVVISNECLLVGARTYAFIANFIFIYAIFSAVAAVLSILKVAKWYDDYQT
ncbi:hypothetical protein, partial [Vibrio sp. V11_P1A41T118]|uniref:hypothetical protein n=1 Tax=Vibrio sp. V11_P1A41T118 TaxID=1938666 RepID=UPI00159507F6